MKLEKVSIGIGRKMFGGGFVTGNEFSSPNMFSIDDVSGPVDTFD